MADDEVALVRKVARGDRRAFAVLAERHLPPIERFALRTLGDPAKAQDVAQEVMLRLWQRADRFDASRAKLTTWLHQIAHNLCIDQFRLGARFTDLAETVVEQGYESHHTETEDAIGAALGGLPERQRTALVLTYYQSLPNRDVAAIMDMSVRALESLLARGRKAMRESLEEMQ